jgi:hypothetical protein
MGLLDEAIREHLDLKRRRGADPTEVERAEREALGPVRRAPGPAPTDVEVQDPRAEGGFAYDREDEAWDDAPELTDAPAAAAGPSRREPVGLEPDFGEDSLHDYEPEPSPEPKRSRLSRIFGRPEAETEFDEEEELDSQPRGRAGRAYEEPEPHPVTPEPHPADGGQIGHPVTPEPHPAGGGQIGHPVTPEPHPGGGGQIGDHTVEYHVDEGVEPEPAPTKDEDVLEETPEFLQDTPDHDRLWFEQRPPRDFDFDG